MTINHAVILLIIIFFRPSFAKEEMSGAYQYNTPYPFDFITTAPKNYGHFLSKSFSKDSLKGWTAIILSTGTLYIFDQKILKEIQRFGRKVGFENRDKSREALFIGDHGLIYLPTDFASSILFLGDGWTSIGLSAGFLFTGLIRDNPKAKMVSSEIFQGLLFSGVSTQTLKRITGREIPKARTNDRGRFHFLAPPSDFRDNKSHYDSFPSAHMTTAMTTFTIISENYEDNVWIKPIGYSLISLLAFQLVNTGSHWASDFPLAIGIGYMSGKTIVENGRRPATTQSVSSFHPLWSPQGILGAQFLVNF